jgi:putative transposase
MAPPARHTARLRFGRISVPGATYFVTCCTKHRAPVLLESSTAAFARATMQAMHDTGDIALVAATIMPDHVHLLFTLGPRLQVGQIMGKFKSQTRDLGKIRWRWQDDGFEHRLRTVESIEDYGFYIYMNSYRAGLCPLTCPWTWWLCPQPSIFRFLAELTTTRTVPEAWLGLRDQIAARIRRR